MATDRNKQIQDQVLSTIKQSQDAVIQAVTSWSQTVSKLGPQLPEMPTVPLADTMPKPSEASDQFFEFAQKLLASQQDFVQKLLAALPGQDKRDSTTP